MICRVFITTVTASTSALALSTPLIAELVMLQVLVRDRGWVGGSPSTLRDELVLLGTYRERRDHQRALSRIALRSLRVEPYRIAHEAS